MSRSHSAGVAGSFFGVVTDFMFLCLAKTDDVRHIASLCVGHVHNDTAQPTEQIDPLLPLGFTGILPCDDWAVKDRFTPHKVQFVSLEVAKALCFVPTRHNLIVAMKK